MKRHTETADAVRDGIAKLRKAGFELERRSRKADGYQYQYICGRDSIVIFELFAENAVRWSDAIGGGVVVTAHRLGTGKFWWSKQGSKVSRADSFKSIDQAMKWLKRGAK